LIHIQDEADLRLRSNDARDGLRSRASKVQQHVVTIVASHRRSEIPTEMEALGDKTAATLANGGGDGACGGGTNGLVELLLANDDGGGVDGGSGLESDRLTRGEIRATHLWDNTYFYIANVGDDSTYVKIYLHNKWAHPRPSGLGSEQRSKTLAPKHYGESPASPVRSRLLLRAWMLWRAQANAWHTAEAGRARQFKEDADMLEHAIRQLQPQVGGLLGNDRADQLLLYWQPELVAALLR
jgi:hypothetical protein